MRSAIVLGGGVAGAAAAHALINAGWQVRLYERATRFDQVGAALSMWPNAMAALDRLGLADAVRTGGLPFTTMLVADRQERPIIPAQPIDGEALLVTRADLQSALVDRLPPGVVSLDCAVSEIRADEENVGVSFADGRIERADILVDAGGLRSIAADAFDVTYRGYGGVVALSEPVAGDGLGGLAAEYWGRRERFGLFELPSNRRYWFYMRDQRADASPPSHLEVSSRVQGWTPALTMAVAATPAVNLIPFAIHARPIPRHLGEGRIIRVGDAAHAMEPNLGQGACQAIEDAVALAAVARAYPPSGMLAGFEKLRLARVSRIMRHAAGGKYGAHGGLTTQWAVRALFRLAPDRLTTGVTRSIHTLPSYSA